MMRPMRDALPFNAGDFGNSPNRREIFRLIGCRLAACEVQLNAATPESPDVDAALEAGRLWERGFPETITECAYHMDATILLLSVPVLRRIGVGDARVALRQTAATSENGPGNRLVLEFAAASDTARSHGLDRMGWNRYAMRLQRDADANASCEFSCPVDRVRGELENITQKLRPVRFQIWIDRESPVPIPLRVEFQARSFLRLTLEAVPNKLPGQEQTRAAN